MADRLQRLVVYDRTAPGLSTAWWAGGGLYRALGRVSRSHGAASWAEALDWMLEARDGEPIGEVQIWAHGKWGDARFGAEALNERSLLRGAEHARRLDELAQRLAPGALFWFRTCETFGAEAGLGFAPACAERLGARVAGHTFVIGVWQSGLHALDPGARPSWAADEGLLAGTPRRPLRAAPSSPIAPRTITCFRSSVPEAYIDHST